MTLTCAAGSGPYTIPAGGLIVATSNGLRYRSTASVTVPASGTATVAVQDGAYLTRLWQLADAQQFEQASPELWEARLSHALVGAPDRMRRARERGGCALRGCTLPIPWPNRYDHKACAKLQGQLHRNLGDCPADRIRLLLEADATRPLVEAAMDGLCLPHGVALAVRYRGTVAPLPDQLRVGWYSMGEGCYIAVVLGPCGAPLALKEVQSQEGAVAWAQRRPALRPCGHLDPGSLCR